MWPGRPERAAFAGRRETMDALASGRVRPGGTHNASPLCATAALVTLRELGDPTVVQRIDDTGHQMMEAARKAPHDHGIPCSVQGVGAMFQTVWFVSAAVTDDDLAATRTAVTEAFKTLRPEAPPAERGGRRWRGRRRGRAHATRSPRPSRATRPTRSPAARPPPSTSGGPGHGRHPGPPDGRPGLPGFWHPLNPPHGGLPPPSSLPTAGWAPRTPSTTLVPWLLTASPRP